MRQPAGLQKYLLRQVNHQLRQYLCHTLYHTLYHLVSYIVISLTRREKWFLYHSASDYNVIITTHTTQGARANKEAGDLGNSSPSPRQYLVPRSPATAGSDLIHVISLTKPHCLSRAPGTAGAELRHVVSRTKHIACLVPTYCLGEMTGFSGCFLWLIEWYGLVSDMTCF